MGFDIGLPFQSNSVTNSFNRDETFIVFFEGFIKNPSEGIVRTMLRDEEDWIFFYPKLKEFEEMDITELYDNTMLFPPFEMLKLLSNDQRSDDNIYEDLKKIEPDIILANSLLTRFEFALYNILGSDLVKKCYIYKEGTFYKNEINYIEKRFNSVINKIELVDNMDFATLFNKAHATTVFLIDPAFIFDYIKNNVKKEEIENTLFILLNTIYNVEITDDGTFIYSEQYQNTLDNKEEKYKYNMISIYNFAIDYNEDE